MTKNQILVLQLLLDHPEGLYGSDIVRLSNGVIGSGTVYTILAHLVDADLAYEVEEPPTDPEVALPRYRHFITKGGQRALLEAAAGGFVPSAA